MSGRRSWPFDYAGLPDEGPTAPPHIWVPVRGPAATEEYPCLLDSGSSFSAFPLVVADELGVRRDLLEADQIRTVNGMRDVWHLRHADQVGICLDEDIEVKIAPYFLPPEVIEEEEIESEYYILGRDFFLPLEVTFLQAQEQVVLTELQSSH